MGPLRTVRERLDDLGHPVDLGTLAPGLSTGWSRARRWPDDVVSRYAQWRGELNPVPANCERRGRRALRTDSGCA
ncbi:hypothetical protein HYE82_08565 [Streptomyces sp. BR123]|uniref:hypothetical protein n=1 Tax=Streptomyces sp. BR123 TaxID=2749828 RepID=UPI0015C4D666|nr:hypothetical protein [Streptomyces sp. BR123]NXY94444.1 hypothetical protein [Streptomyces sp. BR123]